MRRRGSLAPLALLLAMAASPASGLTAAQVADVAPAGAPDGKVDDADVDLVLRAAAGDATLDADGTERGDCGKVTPLSPSTDHPQLVRPNPNPVGPVDVGDAVVVARRAAGLIAFGQVNEPPALSLSGDGSIVGLPAFTISGTVTDDRALAGGWVELAFNGVSLGNLPIVTAAGALSGTFARPVNLAEGRNEIVATPHDADGRRGPTVTALVTFDDTPPDATIDSPPEGFVTNADTVDLAGTASDASGVSVSVGSVNGVVLPPDLWGATVPLTAEGANELVVVVKDGAVPPNVTTLSRVVVHDTTAPKVAVDATPAFVNAHTLAVTGTVSDEWGIAKVEVGGVDAVVTWDASSASGSWLALVPIDAGENAFEAVATDVAGNDSAPAAFTVTGDFTPPTVALASAAFVAKSPAAVTLAFSEPVYVEELGRTVYSPAMRVDSGSLTTPVPLVEGANALTVEVRDLAGNETDTEVTVTLDTHPPTVKITRVSNAAFTFLPAGGLDGVATNAPSVVVAGTVSDTVGVASVKVNGFDAAVDASTGTFTVSGVPLVPRGNAVGASATDLAGNVATDTVTVNRDAEGPVVTLDLARAAYVSGLWPAPAPFGVVANARYVSSPGDLTVTGQANDPYFSGNVTSVAVTFDGAQRAVTGSPPFSTFTFTLPTAALHASGLHLLQVTSTDGFGNQTVDVQSMLAGQWVKAGATIPNVIGAAAGPAALSAISSLLTSQVAAMNGDIPDASSSIAGVTVTIYGIAFCEPPGDPMLPPYSCTPSVKVTLSLEADGHVGVAIHIPTLYAGVGTHASGITGFLCGTSSQGYLTAVPADVTFEADFVNGASGVSLEAVSGTTQVSIGSLGVHTHNGCVDGAASLLGSVFTGIVEQQFANQIPTLLSSVDDLLSAPQLADANTGRAVWIARASNDAGALRFWLDGHGDPCPDASAKTNITDPATGAVKPCPADSPRLSPGSYAGTPNPDASTLPTLDLVAPDGTTVGAEVGVNDEFVNYMVHEQWAMGAFDLTIDQSTLGASSSFTLDTSALSLFLADLKRADVVRKVPLGSKVAIQVYPPLPPVLKGREAGSSFYDLALGDMRWKFVADTDGDGTYETELFTAAVSLTAPAKLSIVSAATDDADDDLAIDLGTPTVSSDVVSNPLVLSEASIRSAISTLVTIALPQLTGGLTSVALPTNTARFSALRIEAAQQDFLVLSGALLQTVTVTSPASGAVVTSGTVTVQGTVAGLQASGSSTVAVWLPNDTTGRGATITSRPDANSLAFSLALPAAALATGENTVRVVATDANGAKAMVKLTLTKTASGVTAGAASGCGGCDGAGSGANPLGLFVALALFAGLGLRRRPRGTTTLHSTALPLFVPLVAAVVTGGMPDCTCSCSHPPPAVEFHGAPVAKNPVFILNTLQLGDDTQGFNVDGDSPNGDAAPDNALAALGPMANGPLADAVTKGSLLLLVQLDGVDHLPAPGESGTVDATAFLGVDEDDDPTDNFSGTAKFAKDPASFDASGKPLIVFHGAKLTGNRDGTVAFSGGPAAFRLAIPIQGSTLPLTISPTFLTTTLRLSALRKDGLDADGGLLGGVIPAAPLATPIPGLNLQPLSILAAEIDVDLNGDGTLDHSATADNPDGLSAAFVFTGVPAYLTDDHVNRKPVVTLDALPATTNDPHQKVTGTVADPDGDCTKTTVALAVNGGASTPATVTKAAKACAFQGEVTLPFGADDVVATATDSAGGVGTADVKTQFVDVAPPTVTLTAPTGHVSDPSQTVEGVATDDAQVTSVQLDVNGTQLLVTADQIGADGSFAVPVTLPALGPNTITAVAVDEANNSSAPATLVVTLDDVDAPTVTFTGASCATSHVDGDGPWTLPEGHVAIDGTLADNAGVAGIGAKWSLDGGDPAPLTIDPDSGAFEIATTLGLGAYDLELAAVDASGNHLVVHRTLTVADETPPVVTVVAPDPLTRVSRQELVLSVTDDWAATETISTTASIDGGAATSVPFDAATSTFRLPVQLVVGANALVIEAKDPSGNVAHLEGAIELVDDVPPVLTLTSPDDGSTTFETTAHVAGSATDDIGPLVVTASAGATSVPVTLAADGSFSVDVPLALGANVVLVSAVDAGGNATQLARQVARKDPNAVATLELAADPSIAALGNDAPVTLTAKLTRLAGGPVPDGTLVTFAATPTDDGFVTQTPVATVGGVATAPFVPGLNAGLVTLSATSGGVTDTATVTLATPTSVAADVCLAETKTLAGVSVDLALSPDATAKLEPPEAASATTLGPAQAFHVYNRAALPTKLLVAGTQAITGAADGSPIARVTWPLDSGLLRTTDVLLQNPTVSDEQGATKDGTDDVYVCKVTHLLGVLPPRVTIDRLATPVTDPHVTVTGKVDANDLATCTAELDVNGAPTPLDVTTGSFSADVTLVAGANDLKVIVTDAAGRQGSDEKQVVYAAPNTPPTVSITTPGQAVSSGSGVVVSGAVSDPDDGLVGLTVTVRVGSSAPAPATIDAGGTYRATVDLPSSTNTITVTATDARGASSLATETTQVVAPIPPPRVTISSPTDGQASTTQTLALVGRVDDGGNPATLTVKLTVNGASEPVTFSPFTRTLSATLTLDAGTNVVEVTATDVTSQTGVATVRVDYDPPDAPPKVTITSPASGATWASGPVTVRGTVKDDHPLSELQSLTVNGVAATVDASAGTFTATLTLGPGAATLTAKAVDGANQTATATVTVTVIDPVVVVNKLQIGGPTDGFNVDSTPMTAWSDAAPDNALSGLGSVANGPLQDQINGANGSKPLVLLFELVGMGQLPAPGQSVTVTMNGYVGIDPDGDASNNFTGSASFQIDPSSYDANGQPLIQFKNVVVTNNFGSLQFDTFPSNPAHFQLSVDSTDPPLVLKTDPAYVSATASVKSDGLRFSPALLGGVVPASTLAVPITAGGLDIVPLQLILSDDPANPVPDVDLNHDGLLDWHDATASNRDGCSVGIVFTAVPAHIAR